MCDQKPQNHNFKKLDRTCDHRQVKLLTKIVVVTLGLFRGSLIQSKSLTGMLSMRFACSGCDICDISDSSNNELNTNVQKAKIRFSENREIESEKERETETKLCLSSTAKQSKAMKQNACGECHD